MEYKTSKDKLTLDSDECNKVVNDLNYIVNSLNQILEMFSDNKKVKVVYEDSEEVSLSKEIKKFYTDKKITYKQYKVLKYMIENQYFSDAELCKSTEVSYSSISQWKKKGSVFKSAYDRILLLKTI